MASSLHYVTPLQLSDTFNEWFLRSNDLIDVVNKINVYNVDTGWGLAKYRSIDGTTLLRINIGQQENEYDASGGVSSDWKYGLRFIDDPGTTSASNPDVSTSRKILTLDFENLPGPSGGVSGNSVMEGDFYAFATSGGTAPIRRVAAQDMLPYGISGDHRFYGNIYFDGTHTTINSSELNIDDKLIYLATSNTGDSTGGYLNDTNLDGAGIIIRGASGPDDGDKRFTYEYTEAAGGRTFSAFRTNIDLQFNRALSEDNTIDIHAMVDDDFDIAISQLNSEKLLWNIRKNKVGDSQGRLLFFYEDKSTGTTQNALILTKEGTVKIGELDGSVVVGGVTHDSSFSYLPAAYSIPTTGNSGDKHLHYKWTDRKIITQTGHGFSAGQCLRIYPHGITYTQADWTSKEKAEVIAIVEDHAPGGSHDQFTAVYSGLVDLSNWTPSHFPPGWTATDGTTLDKGQIYFLSGGSGGFTAAIPDTTGLIKKPVLLAVDEKEALFVNYLGHEVSTGDVATNITGDYIFHNNDEGGYLTVHSAVPNQEFKNKIINGDFTFWQRAEDGASWGHPNGALNWDGSTGTRLKNDGGTFHWCADMWMLDTRQHGTYAEIQKYGHTAGGGVGVKEKEYFNSEAVGSYIRVLNNKVEASKRAYLINRIEDCTTLQPPAGKSYATLSYWCKTAATSAAPSEPMTVQLWQVYDGNSADWDATGDFGGGATMCMSVTISDDEEGTTSATGGTYTPTTSWARKSHTFIVQNSASMTAGPAAAGIDNSYNWLEVRFGIPTEWGASSGVDIARVQLEAGNEETDFESRPVQIEETLVNRYYQRYAVASMGYGESGGTVGGMANFYGTPYPLYGHTPSNTDLTGKCVFASDIYTTLITHAGATTDIKLATPGRGFLWEKMLNNSGMYKSSSVYHFDFGIYD
tara:strand:- start:7298 stop:10042 length:2745 start_codon:yes stop_codon:yes gene_type:complete